MCESEEETVEIDAKQSEVKSAEGEASPLKHQEMPKLKVKVFSVEVSEGEFWSADLDEWTVDSDFEEGDTKEDEDFRREMKQIRLA